MSRLSPTNGSEGINQSLSWLVPVIKTAANVASEKRPRLEFFRAEVLELARRCATVGANAASRSAYDTWVVSFWSLFPCFCHHPLDLEENLARLVPTLVKAIEDSRYHLLVVS
jgi:NUC173 domain